MKTKGFGYGDMGLNTSLVRSDVYGELIVDKIIKRRKGRKGRPVSKKKQIDNLTYRLKVCQDELAQRNQKLADFRGLLGL